MNILCDAAAAVFVLCGQTDQLKVEQVLSLLAAFGGAAAPI